MAKAQILWTDFAVDGLTHHAPWDMHGRMQEGHIESMNCWCAPDLEARCKSCKGDGCWECGGEGFVAGSIQDPPRIRYVVHRRFHADDDA